MIAAFAPSKSIFPLEPLDSRDRKILELVCKYGKEGQSFNKLVEEARPFASRSTFALRIERLQRLNYVEKLLDKERKQVKRIRGTLQARMLMWQVNKMKEETIELEKLITEKEKELSKRKEMSPEDIKTFGDFFQKVGTEKITAAFGSVAVLAVTYGEAAAGDIFLPSVTESFRKVVLKLGSIIKKNPRLAKAIAPKERPSEETVKEAKLFFDEFGEEILERLPERLQSKKAAIEKVIKHPQMLRFLPSVLWT